MLCGYLPFQNSDENIIYKNIQHCKYTIPDYCSSELKDLLSKILVKNPKKRYTLNDIINHPWYKKVKYNIPNINQEIDVEIIDIMTQLGYDNDDIITSINNIEYDSLYATYFLLCKKYKNIPDKIDTPITVRKETEITETITPPKLRVKTFDPKKNIHHHHHVPTPCAKSIIPSPSLLPSIISSMTNSIPSPTKNTSRYKKSTISQSPSPKKKHSSLSLNIVYII